jgi:hypothetical protein
MASKAPVVHSDPEILGGTRVFVGTRVGFEAFITADQNLEFQQSLARSSLFVLVFVAPSNALEDLLPLVPAILAELSTARAGRVVRVRA